MCRAPPCCKQCFLTMQAKLDTINGFWHPIILNACFWLCVLIISTWCFLDPTFNLTHQTPTIGSFGAHSPQYFFSVSYTSVLGLYLMYLNIRVLYLQKKVIPDTCTAYVKLFSSINAAATIAVGVVPSSKEWNRNHILLLFVQFVSLWICQLLLSAWCSLYVPQRWKVNFQFFCIIASIGNAIAWAASTNICEWITLFFMLIYYLSFCSDLERDGRSFRSVHQNQVAHHSKSTVALEGLMFENRGVLFQYIRF